MDKQSAALDASFWINLYKAGLVEHLTDYFDLFVPTTVLHEVEYTPPDVDRLTPAGEAFRRWRKQDRLTIQDPTKPVDWFHPGENAAIGLAREHGYVLLIDDQAPYHLAKARGLRVVGSADFIVLLYGDSLLTYEEAEEVLVRSEIGKHLKRAALTALAFLDRKKDVENDDDVS